MKRMMRLRLAAMAAMVIGFSLGAQAIDVQTPVKYVSPVYNEFGGVANPTNRTLLTRDRQVLNAKLCETKKF